MAFLNAFNAVGVEAPPTYIKLGEMEVNSPRRIISASKEDTTYGETRRVNFEGRQYTFLPKKYCEVLTEDVMKQLGTGALALIYKGRTNGDQVAHASMSTRFGCEENHVDKTSRRCRFAISSLHLTMIKKESNRDVPS